MIIINAKIPDISQYIQYIQTAQISDDATVLIVYKPMSRSDDVVVDFYLNEISDNTLIAGGKLLVNNAILAYPNYDLGFKYSIYIYDLEGTNSGINKYNAYNFYLQFTSEEGKDWEIE